MTCVWQDRFTFSTSGLPLVCWQLAQHLLSLSSVIFYIVYRHSLFTNDILYVALNWLQYYITSFTCVFVYIFCNIGIPVTNCEGERSFSTLSRVKNHLRSTMGQTRLSSLSTIPWYKQYHWQIFHEKKQEEVILKSTQFAVLHVLSTLIRLQVNCISFIIPIYKM